MNCLTEKNNEMNKFKNLLVWQKAVELAVEIYRLTSKFPKHEIFRITSQIQRSSSSIAFNIAEGAGLGTKKEFSHFLDIALGSTCEAETQLIISEKLGYIKNSDLNDKTAKIEEIQKMLYGLKKSNFDK
jgi:four helix bundle protein